MFQKDLILIIFVLNVSPGQFKAVFENVQQCKENSLNDSCQSPCLAKCCPEGHILTRIHSGDLSCKPDPTAPLPNVDFDGQLTNKTLSGNRFYAGALPTCYGYANDNWNYQVVEKNQFRLVADYEDEFELHVTINESDGTRSNALILSYVRELSAQNYNNDYLTGTPRSFLPIKNASAKELLHFCFDVQHLKATDGQPRFETVALICPKEEIKRHVNIFKCCPGDQSYNHHDGECQPETASWGLPVNGHLIDHQQLTTSGILKFGPLQSFANKSVGDLCGSNFGEIRVEIQKLHFGPDGQVYFVDQVCPTGSFCIDHLMKQEVMLEDDLMNQVEDENPEIDEEEDSSEETSVESIEEKTNPCGFLDPDSKYQLIIMSCQTRTIFIPKCCEDGYSINFTGQYCIKESTKKEMKLQIYQMSEEEDNFIDVSSRVKTQLIPSVIENMMGEKENLNVVQKDFLILVNQSLLHDGKLYDYNLTGEKMYCVENSYDSYSKNQVLQAIIISAKVARINQSNGTAVNKNSDETVSHDVLMWRLGSSVVLTILIFVVALILFFLCLNFFPNGRIQQ